MRKLLIIGAGGYIGSALLTSINSKQELKETLDIKTIDLQGPNFNCPYDLVNKWHVGDYSKAIDFQDADFWGVDTVLLLAGNSSVPNSTDLYPTFKNNVQNFAALINLLENKPNPPRLIYISSGSVYGNNTYDTKDYDEEYMEERKLRLPLNPYDTTKQIIDLLASQSKLEYIGLRLGTVNGFSPNLRADLMINSMLFSFHKKGYIEVNNTKKYRPILYIEDLIQHLIALIQTPIERGVYNLHSFNSSIGSIAKEVAFQLDCPIKFNPDSHTYSFTLDSTKLHKALQIPTTQNVDAIVESLKQVNWTYVIQNEHRHRRLKSYV